MARRAKLSISMPPEHAAALKAVAAELYGGNVSALVQALIEENPVTKSALASSAGAT